MNISKINNPYSYIALSIILGLSILVVYSDKFKYLSFTNIKLALAQSGIDATTPTPPTNLKVYGNLPTTKDGNSRDDLSWTASTNDSAVKSYLVYQIIYPNVYDPNPLAEVATTTYSRTINSNGYPTDYSYYVVAKYTDNNLSEKSNIAHMSGVWGDILDALNYRYVRGAKIEVISQDGSKKTAVANSTGAYLINLSPGEYTVNYSAKSYISQTWPITVVENQMSTRNIFFTKTR